jgi:hypothetical protein
MPAKKLNVEISDYQTKNRIGSQFTEPAEDPRAVALARSQEKA